VYTDEFYLPSMETSVWEAQVTTNNTIDASVIVMGIIILGLQIKEFLKLPVNFIFEFCIENFKQSL
jgi:hypothetical protein